MGDTNNTKKHTANTKCLRMIQSIYRPWSKKERQIQFVKRLVIKQKSVHIGNKCERVIQKSNIDEMDSVEG